MSVIRVKSKSKVKCRNCQHVRFKPQGEFCQRMFLYIERELPRCPYFKVSEQIKEGMIKDRKKNMKQLNRSGICRNWMNGKCNHYHIEIGVKHNKCPNYRNKGKRSEN